jgi:SAM-dependent methyltransferase
MSLSESLSWAEHPDLVAFYAQHRNRPEDLYPSERRFLPWLARQADSVLDIGCAAGGFSNVWRHFHPDISYVGVDVSASLVEVAQKVHPDLQFYQGNCAEGLPLPDRYATVVSALGWLHWEPRYLEAMIELWRLTDRYLFFDIRLVVEPDQIVTGKQQVAFHGEWDGETTTPYVTVAWRSLAELLVKLEPAMIAGQGYWGKPADTVMGIDNPVCFAAFVLEKHQEQGRASLETVCVDLPFAWPASLTPEVALLRPDELESLIPRE